MLPAGLRRSQPWEGGHAVGRRGARSSSHRTRRAAPGVTLHLGLGWGARPAGRPLCPAICSVGRPVARCQQLQAVPRCSLCPGSAG